MQERCVGGWWVGEDDAGEHYRVYLELTIDDKGSERWEPIGATVMDGCVHPAGDRHPDTCQAVPGSNRGARASSEPAGPGH